ncbi:deoxyadenosine/deoxycytidine kinase [Catalinimonas alkaloidigena]|uniref:deoxynucleoside kinase n=1 Tax=Catalinimonas alkaloidigena TaxID=1075417 RepID=UPI002406E8AF|nr:deoxynucleoside kinase [Catalinimonas alkaloidigena]MDF9797647.1 deoxyadenosine/deoxycytidine kinase [Catalinimonas alkaloidigena]
MLIAVAGNIGTGKTTLVRKLADYFGYQAEYEAIHENPYLSLFYRDMERWAFPLQVYFLGHRFRQGLSLNDRESGVILDRTIYEDANVFAKNLYRSNYLSQVDYENYLSLYQSMVGLIPKPDILVYLKGKPKNLKYRISHRSEGGIRSFEREISLAYLKNLDLCYASWISNYTYSTTLTIDIDTIDLAKDEHFETLVKNIQNQKRCVT